MKIEIFKLITNNLEKGYLSYRETQERTKTTNLPITKIRTKNNETLMKQKHDYNKSEIFKTLFRQNQILTTLKKMRKNGKKKEIATYIHGVWGLPSN